MDTGKKIKKVTNQEQYHHLVRIMNNNKDIALSQTTSPTEIADFWVKIASELNSLGPPNREPKEWKKVWTDYKSFVKKKLVHNKRESEATGGGPNKKIKLTPNEENVAAILSLNETIEGDSGRAFGVPEPIAVQYEILDASSVETAAQVVETEEIICTNFPENPPRREDVPRQRARQGAKGATEAITSLVERQIKLQESMVEKIAELSNNMQLIQKAMETPATAIVNLVEKQVQSHKVLTEKTDEISYNIRKIFKEIEKNTEIHKNMYTLQAEALEETRRHNLVMEKLALQKIEKKKYSR